MKLDLTKEEIQAMAAMLDIAVKARGLHVAETAVALIRKLEAATDDQPPAETQNEKIPNGKAKK